MSLLLPLAFVFFLQLHMDSTALTFTIGKEAFVVRVGRWMLRTNKKADMNRFVDLHLKEIDPNKIMIYGDSAAEYKTFEPVIEILKRHDWMNFRLGVIHPGPNPATPKVKTK
jgi:hypothetical protein